MLIRVIFVLYIALSAPQVQAGLYLELGYESGGDSLLATTTSEEINAAGGIRFGLGMESQLGVQDNKTLTLTLGYISESINASDVTAKFESYTLDTMLIFGSKPHRLGIGLSYHIDPEFKNSVAGLLPFRAEFENSTGAVLQYAFQFDNQLQLGLRYTNIEYRFNEVTFDASSLGVFISSAF